MVLKDVTQDQVGAALEPETGSLQGRLLTLQDRQDLVVAEGVVGELRALVRSVQLVLRSVLKYLIVQALRRSAIVEGVDDVSVNERSEARVVILAILDVDCALDGRYVDELQQVLTEVQVPELVVVRAAVGGVRQAHAE